MREEIKRKASTSSNFTQRKQREQDRLHKDDNERQNSFSLCEVEEEAYKEREGSNKEREMERITSISEAVKREANNRNNESGPRNSSLYSQELQ